MSAPPLRLAAALLCANHGLAVFPLWFTRDGVCQCPARGTCPSPGKHPISARWRQMATTDPAVIARLWARQPWNIAIACGPSRILVLDIDPRHGGDETLRGLIAAHGPLPHTVEAITGGDGRHLYFASPGGISNRSPFAGIDVRGDGGYVVAPGSVHVSGGTYEWEASSHPDDMPIALAPEWLLTLLRQPVTPQCAAPLPERIPEGGRNDWLTSIAGTFRMRGLTTSELHGCLAILNASRCQPPLADAEVWTIARSVARYEPALRVVPPDSPTPSPKHGRYSLRGGR